MYYSESGRIRLQGEGGHKDIQGGVGQCNGEGAKLRTAKQGQFIPKIPEIYFYFLIFLIRRFILNFDIFYSEIYFYFLFFYFEIYFNLLFFLFQRFHTFDSGPGRWPLPQCEEILVGGFLFRGGGRG